MVIGIGIITSRGTRSAKEVWQFLEGEMDNPSMKVIVPRGEKGWMQ